MSKRYIPPERFCVYPRLTYWEVDGKPVSDDVGMRASNGVKKPTEIARNLHLYMGRLVDD